ncbi:MAG: efflux RND transporter periplasmic adaptor subunit [Acidobacteriota bacterium]
MKNQELKFIAIIFALSVTVGCKVQAVEKAPVPVKVKTIELASNTGGMRYSASIVPRTEVQLAFRVSGYIDALHQVRGVDGQWRNVQEGDVIPRGTVLAQVRRSDYAVKVTQAESQTAEARAGVDSSKAQLAEAESSLASAKAQLAEAEAAYERAKLDFERAKNLYEGQSLTKADYDAAKSQYDMAQAKLNSAKSQVAVVNAKIQVARAVIDSYDAKVKGAKAVVAEAAIPLQDTALRAPMNCVVLQKSVEVGTLVSPGAAAFVIADTSSVKAIFGVPDLMVKQMKLGNTLKVTTEAALGEDFQGQITAISPAADPKSRVFDIEVTIPNAQNLLKVGMIAALTVEGETNPSEAIPVVPLNAIVKSGNHENPYAVFVIEEHSGRTIARQRPLKLGETLGNTVAVIDGLKAGERVITTGANLIQNNDSVQIIP